MYAVRRRRGRSVEEALAIVVEDVLAVVGRVEHCRLRPTLAEHRDDAVQHEVGLTDGVVVGVDELRTVLRLSLRRRVGQELGVTLRIAVAVVEVRSVRMQHYQLLLALLGEDVLHVRQQTLVAGLRRHVASDDANSRADEHEVVGLIAEEVDERVVGLLVGDERGVEACLAERRDEAFFAVQTCVVLGRSRSEQHRHTLVRGVRLREHMAEHAESVGL